MVEVVLRNRLHAAASAQFAKSDWYQDVLKHHGDLLWHNKIAVNPSITNDYYRKGAAPHDKKSIWNGTVKKPLKHWRSPAEGKLEEVIYDDDTAKVSVVGAGMLGTTGVAARMFGAIGRAGVHIDIVSTSEISISCLILWKDLDKAVQAIHD